MGKNGEPPSKKAKTSKKDEPEPEPETKMVKHNLKFCTLEQALKVDAQDLAKRIKRMDSSYFVLQVCNYIEIWIAFLSWGFVRYSKKSLQ